MPTARILVVDDDDDFRRIATRMLREAGYEVDTAADGTTAIARYRAGDVDLILLDLYLPGTDGIETTIRLQHEFPEARIVAVSGGGYRNQDEVLDMARRVGAAGTLAKPLDQATLLATIAEVLDSQR